MAKSRKVKRNMLPIIISLILLALIILSITLNFNSKNLIECTSDADCVPSGCCHSISCVPIDKAPYCEGIFCTQDCQSNTMDCQQGSCGCIEGQCSVNWKLK